jgi:Tfp pilus assembly protein PilN
MTQVNLLPPAVRSRQKVRRVTVASVGAVAAVVVLLLGVFVMQAAKVSRVNHQLAAQQALNAGLRSQIANLQTFEQLKEAVTAKQALVDGVMAGQILWSNVLQQISASTAKDMYFTSVTGQMTDSPSGLIAGTIQFDGKALTHLTVAQWLDQLQRVPGWANSWISSATREESTDGTDVMFSGTVDLTTEATSNGRPK